MRIAQLELDNIGVFEHQEIEFREKTAPDKAEIHILTGVNGSGKSTILYALAGTFQISPSLQSRFLYNDERSVVRTIISYKSPEEIIISTDKNQAITRLKTTKWLDSYLDNFAARTFLDIQRKEFDFAVFAYAGSRSLASVKISTIQDFTGIPLQSLHDFNKPLDSQGLLQWIANTKAKVAFASKKTIRNLQTATNYL